MEIYKALDQLKISTGRFFAWLCMALLHFAHDSNTLAIPWLLGWGLFLVSPPKPEDPRLLWFLYHQACSNIKQYLCAHLHTIPTINTASHNPKFYTLPNFLYWHLCKQRLGWVLLLLPLPPPAGQAEPHLWVSTQLQWGSGGCSGRPSRSDCHISPLWASGPLSALAMQSCSSGSCSCWAACGLVSLEVYEPWQVHAHKTGWKYGAMLIWDGLHHCSVIGKLSTWDWSPLSSLSLVFLCLFLSSLL